MQHIPTYKNSAMPRHHIPSSQRGPSQRQLRVGELLRHALSEILRENDIRQTNLNGPSRLRYHFTPRPTCATRSPAFVEPLGGKNADTIVTALNGHKEFSRRHGGRRTPLEDASFAEANRKDFAFRRRAASPYRNDGPSVRAHPRWCSTSPRGLPPPRRSASPPAVRRAEGGPCRDPRSLGDGDVGDRIGEATKTVPYAMDSEKLYRFTALLGARRAIATMREGAVTGTSDNGPAESEILAPCPLPGEIDQVPPAYSAIKVDGERAYDLAREERSSRSRRVRFSSAMRSLSSVPMPVMRSSRLPAARAPISVPGYAILRCAGHVRPCDGAQTIAAWSFLRGIRDFAG